MLAHVGLLLFLLQRREVLEDGVTPSAVEVGLDVLETLLVRGYFYPAYYGLVLFDLKCDGDLHRTQVHSGGSYESVE